MFTTALCEMAKHWKQLECPSIGEWQTKLWYIYTVTQYIILVENAEVNRKILDRQIDRMT